MYLIVGLGNPEEEYSKTRHNMGFDTINKIAEKNDIQITKNKYESLYATGMIGREKVILVKPQTYMNLSGISVKKWMEFYHLNPTNIIVIYDDMDIEPGKMKIRKKGGAGSHNGMKSVVGELGSEDFYRIRVGIGKPKTKQESISYVIGKVPEEEYKILNKATELAAEAVSSIVKEGIDKAMNQYN